MLWFNRRFIGILIEHFAGMFPTWLAPVQVKVLPISEKFTDYAKSVKSSDMAGIRTEIDNRDEKIGYKIREARNERVPYMIVVGEKDMEANKVSLRSEQTEETVRPCRRYRKSYKRNKRKSLKYIYG